MPLSARFDAATLAQLRHDLLARGQTLATLLADVLAGKRPPEIEDLLEAKPGKRPEEVLRDALDQVEGRRKLLDADDDAYGRCGVCGAEIPLPALQQMPWADRCEQHG